MQGHNIDLTRIRVIAPSLGRRFSGVNASMWAVVPEQMKSESMVGLGYHLPPTLPRIRWRDLLQMRDGRWRIWHARRNLEMVAGLVLRHLFRFRFKLLFTSAAQRQHTRFTRLCYHRMDAIIATTAKAASFLDRPSTVVRHGVDTQWFHPPADRPAEWRRTQLPGRYGLGIFGRIRPNKGSEDFADALLAVLPQRPEWTAVFVGEATREHQAFEQRLRQKFATAGLAQRVHFTGFISSEEIPNWYRALSVVVCPSRVEGFGLPCLEAMASGCPVVATRTGAWPEIVQQDITGKLVDCGDVAALTAALLDITQDTNRVVEMGKIARQRVDSEFAIAHEADGIRRVYNALLKSAD